jgi:hypothetical protein
MNKLDFLWKVIARYDQYIQSTNAKAAALLAYSAIVVGGILLKSSDILTMFQNHPVASRLVAFCLAIAAIASVIVLWVTFFVILPFLKSPPKGNSAIFFGDVANHETGKFYAEQISNLNEEAAVSDLAVQTHVIAGATIKKFRYMRFGMLAILGVQLPALAIIVMTRLVLLLY